MTEKRIETKRLILRNFKPDKADYQALYAIMSDEEVNQYLPWYPFKSIDAAKEFYQIRLASIYQKKVGYYFAICLKDNHPIGYISVNGGISHDFGYGLEKHYWNQGIVTEAATAVIDFLKEQGFKYITATHDRHNIGSGKVMQKLGMTYCYSYQEQWQPKDLLVTFRMYQLNLDGNQDRVFKEYWEKYPDHFVEDLVGIKKNEP